MNSSKSKKIIYLLVIGFCFLVTATPLRAAGNQRIGKVAYKVMELLNSNTQFENVNFLSLSSNQSNEQLSQTLKNYTLLHINGPAMDHILNTAPDYLRISIPVATGTSPITLLLYKVDISSNGFTLETSDGQRMNSLNKIVHYRGIIENDIYSLAGLSFSNEETIGIISNKFGNNVFGKIENSNTNEYVFYNDHEMLVPFSFDCGTNTLNMVQQYQNNNQNNAPGLLTTNCVDWYYEIDYDIFVGKGSLANVNSYIQGVFNQVSTMYANDGVSITLQTLYVWTATDPYTGPSTSNYLNQFGAYRTSFAGDLANLVGYNGGGGIAYVNGLCSSGNSFKMGYMGINSTYQTVPTYSWTVEVVTHEDGHLLGSRHTHDCVWNGNNTAIDGCGDAAGYPGNGSCADGPIPVDGTIMSYCHLVSAGINFSLGFGPQPLAVITNNVNNASCLSACSACQTPSQPGTISGATSYCQSSSQTYSVAAVAGATSYTWTLPSGWTGSSTTNSITVTTTSTGGTVSVTADNSCGSSVARTLTVTSNAAPGTPGNLIGNTAVCQSTSQTYSVAAVSGATSYTWILPSGWSGTSTTNSIVATTSSNNGSISVTANNSCGSSSPRTVSVTISPLPSSPGAITGSLTLCPNATQTYSVAAVPGSNLTYAWTLPAGWAGASTSNSISVTASTTGGTVSVTASNTCGAGPSSSIQVTISGNAPATPSTVSATGGNTKVCPGDTKTYSIAAVAGAQSYSWTPPQGATITNGQGTTSVTVLYQSGFTANGTLSVASVNSCGSSAPRTLSIVRNTPARPGVITGSNYSVCNLSNVPYSIVNVAGITYNWSFSVGGASVVSGQGTNSILASFTPNYLSGNLNVTASNACGTSAARALAVKATLPAPTTMTGTATPCANQTGVPYSVSPVPGATSYTWTVPSGSRINDGTVTSTTSVLTTSSTSVTVNFKTTAGNVRVNANNACGTGVSKAIAVTFPCRLAESAITNSMETTIFPNPVDDELSIEFVSSSETTHHIYLHDITGKTMLDQEGISSEGSNSIKLNVSALAPGIYFLEIKNGEQNLISKIAVE